MWIFSPSTIPQKIATIGIRYVTEDAKIADELCTSLLKITNANAVPITDKTHIYISANKPSGLL